MTTVHLLLNPSVSTKRRASANAAIRAAIEARGYDVVELRPSSPAMIVTAIDEISSEADTRFVVAGGDGLLHHALPALVNRQLPVGLVPVGTGNDFARAVGIPSSLDDAVATALGPTTALDLMHATRGGSGTYAATVVTGGFSGAVNERANRLRFPPGQQRYTVATFIELPRLTPVPLELDVDGTVHELETTLFAVANTRYFGGGMAICPDADPTDGLLDVTVVGPTSRFELARVLPTVFGGRHVDHPSVSTYRGSTVGITTPARPWADGEPLPTGAAETGTGSGGGEDGSASTVVVTVAPRALAVAGTLTVA